MTDPAEDLTQAPTSDSEICQAQTKSTHGVLLSAEIVQFFTGKTDAFHLWSFAVTQPPSWKFRKNHMRRLLGMGERRWRKALNQLAAAGLLEIPFRRDSKGRMIGRYYVFYGWHERIFLTTKEANREKGRRSNMSPLDNAKLFNKNMGDSETYVLPSSEKRTDLFTSKGEMGGGCAPCLPSRSTSPVSVEQISDEEMISYRRRFLDRFPGFHTFQVFDDSSAKRKSLAKIFHGYTDAIEEMNWYGAGVFLAVNETDGKGRKRENIVAVRAVFVDLDGAPLEPVLPYHPHLVIESSPQRFHVYWFVKDFPLEAFSDVQKTLAEMFHGDPVVHDLCRVMRVPGFWHQKRDPFASRIIFESHVDPMSYLDIVKNFPPKPRKLWSARQKTNRTDIGYTGPYGAPSGYRNSGLMRFIGSAIRRGLEWATIESEARRWATECSPPLPEREVKTVLRSARRYI